MTDPNQLPELPPLPGGCLKIYGPGHYWSTSDMNCPGSYWSEQNMRDYARASILADRAARPMAVEQQADPVIPESSIREEVEERERAEHWDQAIREARAEWVATLQTSPAPQVAGASEALLRQALEVVREYPDFDNPENLMAKIIDAALRGEQHESLVILDALTQAKQEK